MRERKREREREREREDGDRRGGEVSTSRISPNVALLSTSRIFRASDVLILCFPAACRSVSAVTPAFCPSAGAGK